MGIVIKNVMALMWGGDRKENKNEDEFYIDKNTFYIDNGIIAGIGEKPEGFTEDKVIDGKDRLLMPGLINCHCHAYMTLFRNCADDLSFTDWLFGHISPLEDKLEPEDAYWGAKLAIMEMVKSGTTCFADMHMNIGQTTRAVSETGVRAVIGRGLVGDGEDEGGKRRIDEALEEFNEWKDHKRISFMLAPHAPYTCSQKYLEQVTAIAKDNGLGIEIHLSESQTEMENMEKENHMSPIQYVKEAGIFEVPVLAAHCVNLSDDDREILKNAGVSVATNPVSNMKLGNGFADVPAMLEKGIRVCLGTDGAASNNSLNMFHEMNILGLVHKGAGKKAQCVSAMQVLKAATIDGARALELGNQLGSLAVGKQADLILIDTTTPQLNPENNLISGLVYSANGSEVRTVLVAGEILMEDGELKTMDADEILKEVNERARRLGTV